MLHWQPNDCKATGSAPHTSANPPVFARGTISLEIEMTRKFTEQSTGKTEAEQKVGATASSNAVIAEVYTLVYLFLKGMMVKV